MIRARAGSGSALLILIVWQGCTPSPTAGLILHLDTDLEVPLEIDRIGLRVEGNGGAVDRLLVIGRGPGEVDLPVRLALDVPPDAGDLRVDMMGRRQGSDVVGRIVRLQGHPGQVLEVRLSLDRACLQVRCQDGQTCDPEQGCVSADDVALSTVGTPHAPPRWIRRMAPAQLWVGELQGAAPVASYDPLARTVTVFFGEQASEWDAEGGRWTTHSLPRTAGGWRVIGRGGAGTLWLSDGHSIWEWNGALHRMEKRADPPPLQLPAEFGFFHDGARDTVLLVSAFQEIWELRPGARSWTLAREAPQPAPIEPPFDLSVRAVNDPVRSRLLLLSGGTWEWDGTKGTLRLVHRARAMCSHVAPFFDEVRGNVVCGSVLAGSEDQVTMVEWKGDDWVPVSLATTPGIHGEAVAPAPRRRRVLVGGVLGQPAPHVLTWEWDGAQGRWRNRTPSSRHPRPVSRIPAMVVGDEDSGRVLFFGGFFGRPETVDGDVWEWTGGRP